VNPPQAATATTNAAPSKIAIPDQILLKPGPLTRAERRRMQTHTVVGEQMLSGVAILQGSRHLDHVAVGRGTVALPQLVQEVETDTLGRRRDERLRRHQLRRHELSRRVEQRRLHRHRTDRDVLQQGGGDWNFQFRISGGSAIGDIANALRLLDERAAARTARDWARSDSLRADLAQLDVLVEDTADGQRWRRASEVARGQG